MKVSAPLFPEISRQWLNEVCTAAAQEFANEIEILDITLNRTSSTGHYRACVDFRADGARHAVSATTTDAQIYDDWQDAKHREELSYHESLEDLYKVVFEIAFNPWNVREVL